MNDDTGLARQQTAGLRKLADAIEAHPELAHILRYALSISAHVFEDVPATLATFARATKASGATVIKDYSGPFAHVRAEWDGFTVDLQTDRDEVCEKVVVGEREVTEEVLDPKALAAVPTVTVTRTEPVTEWRCKPLLAAGTETAVAS